MQCRRARPGLGTLVEIAFDSAADGNASKIFEQAFNLVDTLEAQLSAHRADSALNRLCDSAHLEPQPAALAVYEVLTAALDLHQQSQGIFDVTRGTTTQVSSADIHLDADGRIFFNRPLRIDLGGIAKGYVIDRVTDLLQAQGIGSGSVNAGGDLRIFGAATEPVALRFADGFRTIANLRDGAFAASRPGARPMSILHAEDHLSNETHYDGRTQCAVNKTDTVAVFAKHAMIADALTKIALVSAETMDQVCAHYSAEWRRYPFTFDR